MEGHHFLHQENQQGCAPAGHQYSIHGLEASLYFSGITFTTVGYGDITLAKCWQLLSVGEAVMRLDLAQGPALMFRNKKGGGLNVVYCRADGHIGWIDPGEG